MSEVTLQGIESQLRQNAGYRVLGTRHRVKGAGYRIQGKGSESSEGTELDPDKV